MNVHIVTATITKYLAYGSATITKIYGFNNSGADVYLQIHESPTVAASDVPKIAGLHCPTGQWFDWFWDGGLGVSEFLIANSSVQASYTAAAGGVDMTVEYQTSFPACNEAGTALVTVVGDLTTGVANRQIFAESAGPRRLLRLDIKNNNAAARYPIIQASDSADTSDKGIVTPMSIATTATQTLRFGAGFITLRNQSDVIRDGCTVRMVSSISSLPLTFITDTDFNIRGIHAALT